MSRRKPLRSLGDWIGTGGHSFDSSLLENEETAGSPIQSLDIDQLVAGRYQPRRHIDEAYLAELAQSIRQFGIIEPLVARPLANGDYEILAGHMRWQAARQASLTRIPVVVRNADDQTAAAIALVENLLRRELNPVEEGRALQRLREEFNLTQAQLAELLGISQTAISRALGLLSLDPSGADAYRGRAAGGRTWQDAAQLAGRNAVPIGGASSRRRLECAGTGATSGSTGR